MTLDPGFPCGYCGTNAWTACRHRPAEPKPVRPPPAAAPFRVDRNPPGQLGRPKRRRQPGGHAGKYSGT